tara:strand:- start:862 stop:1497 length:636 start_codon:yes stop_codon:yes gene_type:complete
MSYLTNLRNDADYERCFYVFANGENDLSYTLFGVCDDVLLCAYNDAKKFIDDEREYFETLDAKDAVRVAANVALLAAEKAKRDCFEIKLDMSSSTYYNNNMSSIDLSGINSRIKLDMMADNAHEMLESIYENIIELENGKCSVDICEHIYAAKARAKYVSAFMYRIYEHEARLTIGIMNSKLNANSAKWFPCIELMRPKLMRYDGLSKLIK